MILPCLNKFLLYCIVLYCIVFYYRSLTVRTINLFEETGTEVYDMFTAEYSREMSAMEKAQSERKMSLAPGRVAAEAINTRRTIKPNSNINMNEMTKQNLNKLRN